MLHQLKLAALFKMRDQAQRGKRPRKQLRIWIGVAHAGFNKRRQPVKGMFKAVCQVGVRSLAAQAFCGASSRCGKSCSSAVIQRLVRSAHTESEISIADSIVRYVRCGGCGRAV